MLHAPYNFFNFKKYIFFIEKFGGIFTIQFVLHRISSNIGCKSIKTRLFEHQRYLRTGFLNKSAVVKHQHNTSQFSSVIIKSIEISKYSKNINIPWVWNTDIQSRSLTHPQLCGWLILRPYKCSAAVEVPPLQFKLPCYSVRLSLKEFDLYIWIITRIIVHIQIGWGSPL